MGFLFFYPFFDNKTFYDPEKGQDVVFLISFLLKRLQVSFLIINVFFNKYKTKGGGGLHQLYE
jgi:hypothetical protein